MSRKDREAQRWRRYRIVQDTALAYADKGKPPRDHVAEERARRERARAKKNAAPGSNPEAAKDKMTLT